MKTILRLCLIAGVISGFGAGSPTQESRPFKVLHLSGANFGKAPGLVLFSPSGKLYTAYRVPGKSGVSSALRVVIFDPVTGQQVAVNDYALPSASLPRVASAFILSKDGSTLAYAELHAPQVILTIEASTLRQLSTWETRLFSEQDFAPRVSTVSAESLVLSAGKLTHDGRLTAVHEIRKISLNPRDLRQILSEKMVPLSEDFSELVHWRARIHAQREVGQVLPVNDGVLGLTNMMSEGWIQLFDQTGKELATLHNPDCGFVRASLSPDQQVGVAVCERTGMEEAHFGEIVRRDAVVFEVETLAVLAIIHISRLSVKEQGPGPADMWVATPSPAVWHSKGRVLVAVDGSPDSINLYSISADAKPGGGT